MAQALFITQSDLKKYTAVNGNVDADKFFAFIKIAQDIHLQNYLGTKLFDKINNDIVADTLTGNYLTLVNKYIKPMLIHWAMVEYLPFASITIANKGVYKHNSENGEIVNKEEIDFIISKERDIAQHYTRRFIDYICENNNLFVEYNNNSGADMHPDSDATFIGWVI
jgi:hypothetical protein